MEMIGLEKLHEEILLLNTNLMYYFLRYRTSTDPRLIDAQS